MTLRGVGGLSAIDVHQHLWPDELVDRLRARTRPPYLRGWMLHTDGEPPYAVDHTAHAVEARVATSSQGSGANGPNCRLSRSSAVG